MPHSKAPAVFFKASPTDRIPLAQYRGDIYSKAALRDSNDHFRAIRDLGPAVWLPKYKLWAVARFDDVKACLRADDKLISGKGIAANPILNGLETKITLTCDGDVHKRRRSMLMKPLLPAELQNLRQRIQGEADRLVARLKKETRFDAMPTFASHLPVSIVAELVGLKPAGRENMLRWAAGTFEAIGPLNWRTLRAMPALLDMRRYATNLKRADIVPGGWADKIFAAAEDGSLSLEEAQAMVIDYVAPSLDTTILATGHMLQYLAQSPDAFAAVKSDDKLLAKRPPQNKSLTFYVLRILICR